MAVNRTAWLGLLALMATAPCHAFIGMSIPMYQPACAYSCYNVISAAMLDCPENTETSHHDGGMMMKRHGGMEAATPACRAQSQPFLDTLAYCLSTHCNDTHASVLEAFWEENATGDETVMPQWTYSQSLARVNGTPTAVFDDDETMTQAVLVDEQGWTNDVRTISNFAANEARHALYAVILLAIGFGLPIVLTILSIFAPNLARKIKPRLIYPAFWGKHHRAVYRWFRLPTYGQTTYIVIFFLLNILFTGINISSAQPSTWYSTTTQEVTSLIAARTGVAAMALAPLTFLFAGRNNILLYLTNWDHGTYLLLHRWVARMFTLHVVVHSIGELWVCVDNGSYASYSTLPYWIWGCIATVACVAMCIKSVFRSWRYELFLILHIILAVFVLAGTWYHLIYRFNYKWGYHWMLYACFAVWAFDRILRVALIVRNGRLDATLTQLGPIVRVDLKGVNWTGPGRHGYIYFPFVRKWAPWESHPFSVIPSHLLAPAPIYSGSTDGTSTPKTEPSSEVPILTSQVSRGVTFYVKAHSGLTKSLHTLAGRGTRTTALLEGPYGRSSVPSCDRLIVIAGGVGITATLPFLSSHHNAKLYWSVKDCMRPLVDDMEGCRALSGNEKEIIIGGRFNLRDILEIEAAKGGEVLGVVVCGPSGMCDEVRRIVVCLGTRGKKVEMKVEAFSW